MLHNAKYMLFFFLFFANIFLCICVSDMYSWKVVCLWRGGGRVEHLKDAILVLTEMYLNCKVVVCA